MKYTMAQATTQAEYVNKNLPVHVSGSVGIHLVSVQAALPTLAAPIILIAAYYR